MADGDFLFADYSNFANRLTIPLGLAAGLSLDNINVINSRTGAHYASANAFVEARIPLCVTLTGVTVADASKISVLERLGVNHPDRYTLCVSGSFRYTGDFQKKHTLSSFARLHFSFPIQTDKVTYHLGFHGGVGGAWWSTGKVGGALVTDQPSPDAFLNDDKFKANVGTTLSLFKSGGGSKGLGLGLDFYFSGEDRRPVGRSLSISLGAQYHFD